MKPAPMGGYSGLVQQPAVGTASSTKGVKHMDCQKTVMFSQAVSLADNTQLKHFSSRRS